MPLATLTSKGQITIPGKLRKQLHLHAGDKIDFSISGDNALLLRPITRNVDDVFACLHDAAKGKRASIAEMDAAIQKKLQQDFE